MNPYNILLHPKYRIEEIPSWAIIRAAILGAEKRKRAIHRLRVLLAVVSILAAQVLLVLEWGR